MPSSRLCPTILLVEDSDDDAFFFARLLKKCELPCNYVHLADGRAALEYLEKCVSSCPLESLPVRPDLVFLDLKLPGVSGFEILQWLANRALETPLSVAVLSGSDQGMDISRAAALGAPDYFVKPIRLEQLRSRLEAWFGQNVPTAHQTRELV